MTTNRGKRSKTLSKQQQLQIMLWSNIIVWAKTKKI